MGENARPYARRISIAVLWILFGLVVHALILDALDSNPILDEQQWLQEGLAVPYNHFMKTGLASGPLMGLLLGAIFSVVYLATLLTGTCGSSIEFVAWFLGNQGLFYFLARALVAGIALGGLMLMARALAHRVGGLWATLLAIGFAFTAPSLDRIGFAKPHAAMIGFSAALVWALLRATQGYWAGWTIAGILVAAATMTMTSGLGLALPAAWAATFQETEEKPIPRPRRLLLVLAGFIAGLIVFGYPALLHPIDYWHANVLYQFNRQVLTEEGGHGAILWEWALKGFPLWLAGTAGLIWGNFTGRRSLAWAAFLTAWGYLFFLALLTKSSQPYYSLPALPFLALLCSGLVEASSSIRPCIRNSVAAAVLIYPMAFGLMAATNRLRNPDLKESAATAVIQKVPPGKVLLVDSWWGPRLKHQRLLLSPYGAQGKKWAGDPAFVATLERFLPPRHNQWTVLDLPRDIPQLDKETLRRAGIQYIAISLTMMGRSASPSQWDTLLKEGFLLPEGPLGTDLILLFRVSQAG